AVPITAQCPILRHIPASAIFISSSEISPFLESSANRQTSLVPISFPLNLPVNMAPLKLRYLEDPRYKHPSPKMVWSYHNPPITRLHPWGSPGWTLQRPCSRGS